jgi:Ni/Fe-hydrogenase subunit HybB-like protein
VPTASSRWAGADRRTHWQHYEKAYLILAGLSTPLVLSVHTIVSFDFAVSQLPGWHTTIFPPYFVAGAIFSGFAMVLTLMRSARKLFGWRTHHDEAHREHGEGDPADRLIVGYAYAMEFFIAWYSGNPYERFAFINRAFGPTVGVLDHGLVQRDLPQLFWFKKPDASLCSSSPRSSSTSACGSSASSSR